MATIPAVELAVYPDDCDAFGHVHQAAYFRLFERARWDVFAAGPGLDAFRRYGAWPALRRTEADFHQQVTSGDRLRFEFEVSDWGDTSFTVRQRARKIGGEGIAAEAEFVFVTVGRDGRPIPVPPEVGSYFGVRPARRTGVSQQCAVRGLLATVEVTGDGPGVLFVHGFPLDHGMWRPVTGTLTGWRRIAPDLRGMGLSEGPDAEYTMAEYADDMAALLDVLHQDQAVVCGFSMGGYVAFEMVRRHAHRIRALVLVNTRAGADDHEGRQRRDTMIARIQRDGPGFLADEMLPRLLAPASVQTQPDVVRQVRAIMHAQRAAGLVGALTAMRDRQDATSLLATIDVPTLVIAGSDDQLIPNSEARALAEAIPHAHFAMIPDAGHLAPVEQGVNTARVIREFLEALL